MAARKLFHLLCLLVILAAPNAARAQQDATVTVPNFTGMMGPQAGQAAATARLLLGDEVTQLWTADAPVKANQISSQSPAPGEKVAAGSSVQITVLRVYNASLIYDTVSLTLVNTGSTALNLSGLTFQSGEGKDVREFKSSSWPSILAPKNCVQVWSARPKTFTRPADCKLMTNAVVPSDPSRLFWLATAARFRVVRSGDVMAACPIAATRCDVAIPQGDDPEHTSYLAFAYRTNYLTIRNESSRWMGLIGDSALGRDGKRFTFDTTENLAAGDVPWAGRRLAPGQCVVYAEFDPGALPPYDCQVVGYIKIAKNAVFWLRGFSMVSPAGQTAAFCSAPVPGLLSICMVPKRP